MVTILLALLTAPAPCLSPASDLRALAGHYLAETYSNAVHKSRDIYTGGIREGRPIEIIIDPARRDLPVLISTVHEGWGVADMKGACLVAAKADELVLTAASHKAPMLFRKVAANEADLQALLVKSIGLEGCYRAQDETQLCIDGTRIDERPFTLVRDPSELTPLGTHLKVEGDALFWIMTAKPNGWAIYRATWASANDYEEPDPRKPWRVLTRVK